MKRFAVTIGTVLVISLVLTEAHSVLRLINSQLAGESVDLFISPGYQMKLPVQWYLKMTFDDLLLAVVCFVSAVAVYKYSYRLFLLFCIVFGYKVFDMILFWWNYKSSYLTYYGLITVCVIWIILTILPVEKDRGIYKSMI